MYTLMLAVSLFLLTATSVNAQVTISTLYADGTNKTKPTDWIEISNTTSTTYNLNGHRLEDTASSNPIVIEWDTNIIIEANSACLFFVGNRLNKSGDTLYLKNGDSQLDCVAYGDANGGSCDRSISPSGANDYVALVCVPHTPEPTQSPQTPVPTLRPTSTPKTEPTVILTPPPPENETQVLSLADETEILSTPTPTSRSENEETIVRNDQEVDVRTNTPEDTTYQTGTLLLVAGLLCIGIPVAHLVYAEYNKKYFDNQTFD